MNINQIDLNLLKAFDALYQERNVSKAGARLGIAQPSMSNALNRLRALFADPLFQRTPEGMIPTGRAEELAPKVQQMLDVVVDMWAAPEFDPRTATDHIRIAASDLGAVAQAPQLMAYLRRAAPNLRISWVPLDKAQCFTQLDAAEIGLVLGTFGAVPARFHRRAIQTDHFVCIARQQHPQLDDVLSLQDFVDLQHVLMTLHGDYSGVVDVALKKLKRQRQVVMTCAQFAPILDIVASTDLISTIPNSLAQKAEQSGCQVFPLPLEIAPWQTELIWTQKFQASPLGRFIVDAFARVIEA